MIQHITDWLETHWLTPAYSGWLMGGLALFFFAAATNTLAGWLYVISGVMFALLLVAAILPERSLQRLRVNRRPIEPVSAGESVTVELVVTNETNQPKTLVKLYDLIPYVLGKPIETAIELIPAQGNYHWVYTHPTQQRGIYRWETVQMRTASPLGLFWCRRSRVARATAIVYPTVLPLTQCPLVDEMGRDVNARMQSSYRAQGATEGVTRTLRPYRWGDSTRLIHWRTSARYGELRVRELETFTGGQEIVVCLDSAIAWNPENFEQAVIAAASIYFYAVQNRLQVSLWTAGTGLLRGKQAVLEALAAINSSEEALQATPVPELPLVWLTQQSTHLHSLPAGSRWILWTDPTQGDRPPASDHHPGLVIHPDESLQLQLQSPIKRL